MKITYLFTVAAFTCLTENANAQSPDWLWAKAMGGTDYDGASSIALDASGNVYTTGIFQGTVDFDPGAGIFNLTSSGYTGIFISKLDGSGNFVWAKAMVGTNFFGGGSSIKIDASGNVFTTGGFEKTVDFDPSAGIFNLTSAGEGDIFISKLDASGNFVWAKRMGGTDSDGASSIAIDASGNVYTTGSFRGTADFDPDSSGNFNLTAAPGAPGVGDIFISKLDDSGNFVWAKRMGGADFYTGDAGFSLALDPAGNGDVYTTGHFGGTADFDPGAGTFNLTSVGPNDVFISKLDASGNFVWAKSMGGINVNATGSSIAIDASGNVYTTGYFSGTADFDPGAGIFNLTSAGGNDIFISKLNSSGNFVWAKAMGGINFDNGYSIAIDPAGSGDVYTTGSFQGTADFDPGAGVFNLSGGGIFISKLNSSGNFVWAKAPLSSPGADAQSITLDASGDVYVAGYFANPTITFGSITITNADSTFNTNDIFIAKLDHTITGTESVENDNDDISLYPNPATNYLTITLTSANKKVEVTIADITGKVIYSITSAETQNLEVNTKDFVAGVYIVQVQTADFIATKKLIIAK